MKKLSLALGFLAALVVGAFLLPTRPAYTAPAAVPASTSTERAVPPLPGEPGAPLSATLPPTPVQATGTPFAVLPGVPLLPDYRGYDPETLTVELTPGHPQTFKRAQSYTAHDRLIWVGRDAAHPLRLVVAAGTGDRYHVVADFAPGAYTIDIEGSQATVSYDHSPIKCGTAHAPSTAADVRRAAVSAKASPTVAASTNLLSSATTVQAAALVAAADGAVLDVDVAYFIDSRLIDTKGLETITTSLVVATEVINQYLVNSQITHFRWTASAIVPVPVETYAFTDDLNDSLSAIYPYTANAAHTKVRDLVQTTLDAVGADEAMVVVPQGATYAGLAYINFEYGSVTYFSGFEATLAHELGHTFGSQHDRTTDGATASNLDKYNYGHMETKTLTYTRPYGSGSWNVTVGDIMSYASLRMPTFANPNVTWTNSEPYPGYDPVSLVMGVDVTGPAPAYNARTLTESASTRASRRVAKPHVLLPPPATTTATAGNAARISSGGAAGSTYQWQKNGVDLPGETGSTLLISEVSSLDAGDYRCVITSSTGVVTYATSTLKVNHLTVANPNSRLVNISTRALVKGGDALEIAGFVIQGEGSASKRLLVRAGGPALKGWNIANFLSKPQLSLRAGDQREVAAAGKWDPVLLAGYAASVGATPWPETSEDSALAIALAGGGYTAMITNRATGDGVALAEVYEVDNQGGRIVNLSTRAWVDSGDNTQVAGFVINGSGMKTLLIRSSGPALKAQGLGIALEDPQISLYQGTRVVASNANWADTDADAIEAAANATGAYKWTRGSKDAALLITLPPGVYTVHTTPQSNTLPGVGLIELFEVK